VKQDLDRLMQERGLDAFLIPGTDGMAVCNAEWKYMTGNQEMGGWIIKKKGSPATLIYHSLESQQAQRSGLELIPLGRWDVKTIQQSHPTRLAASVELMRQILKDLGIGERVGVYGAVEASAHLAWIDALRQAIPGIQFVGEYEKGLFDTARQTKDADEIRLMEDVGRRTCGVVGSIVRLIQSCSENAGQLHHPDGTPLTIGRVKKQIREECDARSLGLRHGCIFSQGRDSAIGHASGDDSAVVVTGKTIVFDLYPVCERTGYFHDITRTFCPGFAPTDVKKVYEDVRRVFETVMSDLRAGEKAKAYQDRACAMFRELGHPTIDVTWPLEEGYNHSLGHGIGMDVHESLIFSSFADRGDVLSPGSVFTIEPGLYYPEREIGVRLEDTVVCDLDGKIRSLSPFPYDLVIPISGG
jgi:Xaa-Pro aminopeptidase